MEGKELYQLLLELTSDCEDLESELEEALKRHGLNPNELSSEHLRQIALEYLSEVCAQRGDEGPTVTEQADLAQA